MKLNYLIALVLSVTIGCGCLSAKNENDKDAYNITRALETLGEGKHQEALKFIQKELDSNPGNGYAYLAQGMIHYDCAEPGKALSSVAKALDLIPKKDKNSISIAYDMMGTIYIETGDTLKALQNFSDAIKTYNKYQGTYKSRAQIYFDQGRLDEAEADYNTMLKLDPTAEAALLGLGRIAFARGNYSDAMKLYNQVLALYEDYYPAYAYRAELNLKLGNYAAAADDILDALEVKYDDKAHTLLMKFPKEQSPLLLAKIKSRSNAEPDIYIWDYFYGKVLIENRKYTEALDYAEKAYKKFHTDAFLDLSMMCAMKMGDFGKALDYMLQCEEEDTDDFDYSMHKAYFLREGGFAQEAIEILNKYLEKHPDDANGYYTRAFYEEHENLKEEALNDYKMAVMLKPDHAYSWVLKGKLHLERGEKDLAMEAFNKTIEIDKEPTDESCAMYAFLNLGRKDEAIKFMDRIIALDPEDAGNYYDAACLYALMGETEKSLSYFTTCLEKGFKRFYHIKVDDELDPIRNTPEFKALIEKYERPTTITPEKAKMVVERVIHSDDSTGIVEVVEVEEASDTIAEYIEIPIVPSRGCYSVKCSINDLPLDFIFDTGASTVSISQLEANFMLKNGYLKRNDIVGSATFEDATGHISEGTIINLRSVEFGGVKLSNIRANVVKNQKAPLLLGQSVLKRLGSIEIDNSRKKLIIKK